MKIINSLFFRSTSLWFFAAYLLPISVFCQGYEKVLHTSGTEQVGCTDVTVTAAGGVNTASPNSCNADPYWIGYLTVPGSYTFTFSNPIGGARLDVAALDHFSSSSFDELVAYVNGSFYPFTNPGAPSCSPVWVTIWPPGTIRAEFGFLGGASEFITIDETMSSLTIANNYGSGIIFSLYILPCPTCLTNAGVLIADPIELCPGDLTTAPPATQTFLESGDILQYILFSNLADTLGSVLATNSTPEFAFDPNTMQTGITYYIAAIAGNDLGGNVDLGDPCLDISNAIEVIWHPQPSVTFNSTATELCPNHCYDVEVNLTGAPPFQLEGELMAGSNTLSTFSETFQGSTGMLTICVPAGTPAGDITILATELTDALCTCN